MADANSTADPPRHTAGSVALVTLACLATVAALNLGRDFFAPIALAVLLYVLLRPVVRGLQRWRVPAPVGATLVVLAIIGAMVGAGFWLSVPIRHWVDQAPQRAAGAHAKLEALIEPVKRAGEAARQVLPQATRPTSAPAAASTPTTAPATAAPPAPDMTAPALRAFGSVTRVLGEAVEVLVLLLLLLASGDLFARKLSAVVSRGNDRAAAAAAVDDAERVVVRYLLVTALINVGQGTVVALALWWVGLPSPWLWGLATFAVEFVPYLGALLMIGLLTVVGLTTFDGVGRALLAPGLYLLITTLQNNLVSPIAYGRRLELNAVAVFVGVVFWWMVWGVPGAFLAVPILATAKVLADRSDRWKAVGEFLGD